MDGVRELSRGAVGPGLKRVFLPFVGAHRKERREDNQREKSHGKNKIVDHKKRLLTIEGGLDVCRLKTS
jgi:hypothetical protein